MSRPARTARPLDRGGQSRGRARPRRRRVCPSSRTRSPTPTSTSPCTCRPTATTSAAIAARRVRGRARRRRMRRRRHRQRGGRGRGRARRRARHRAHGLGQRPRPSPRRSRAAISPPRSHALEAGRVARVDLGHARDRRRQPAWFTTVANTGFDAEANRWANTVEWVTGTPLYVLAVLRTLSSYRPRRVRVTVDDADHRDGSVAGRDREHAELRERDGDRTRRHRCTTDGSTCASSAPCHAPTSSARFPACSVARTSATRSSARAEVPGSTSLDGRRRSAARAVGERRATSARSRHASPARPARSVSSCRDQPRAARSLDGERALHALLRGGRGCRSRTRTRPASDRSSWRRSRRRRTPRAGSRGTRPRRRGVCMPPSLSSSSSAMPGAAVMVVRVEEEVARRRA